ncbi:MAG: hypothetical protein JWQ19_3902 [Subtercola sp.]|nr:hypothetical protein [Subtercola sp.]
MTTFTVQCGAARYSTVTLTVEADDLETALAQAVADANLSSAWSACDDFGPTFIEAVAEGEDVELWAIAFDQQLPVPDRFTEQGICR